MFWIRFCFGDIMQDSMRVEAQPKNAIYSIVSSHQTVYPEGVRPVTQNLLQDGLQTGAFDRLSSQNQELLTRYFGTSLSAKKATGGLASTTARLRIVRAITSLRDGLPEDVRQKYLDKEVLRLKETPSTRTGWYHKPETVRTLKRKAKERATLEYRKKQSLTTKGFMTKEVTDKISKTARERMTKRRRDKIGRALKGPRNRYQYTSDKAREASMARWHPTDLTVEQRTSDPLAGAIFNLNYINGEDFPKEIRAYFEANPKTHLEWMPILALARRLPFLRYQEGQLWYITVALDGKETKKPLTVDLLRLDPDNAIRFGLLSKKAIEKALGIRIRSTSLFSQSPDTILFQAKP